MKLLFSALIVLTSTAFAAGNNLQIVTRVEFNHITAIDAPTSSTIYATKQPDGSLLVRCFTPITAPCSVPASTDDVAKNARCTCEGEAGTFNPLAFGRTVPKASRPIPPATAADAAPVDGGAQ